MRINHNIPALNAHRMLNRNANVSSSVLERLSSGRKINRASDDAAGMAISEKMKAQVRGLAKAAQNTLDGISLIQTAEGAMNEVHSMLQRMRELAVQSANGTTTDDDRKAIQAEINQLTSEVNRIANGTEFNTRNVLRGNEGPNSNTTVHRMSTGLPAILTGEFDSGALSGATDRYLTIEIDGQQRKVSLESVHNTSGLSGKAIAFIDTINDAIDGLGEAILTFSGNCIKGYEIRTASIGGRSTIRISSYSSGLSGGLGLSGDEKGTTIATGEAENNTELAKATIFFRGIPEDGSYITIGDERIDFYDSRKGPYMGSNNSIDIASGEGTEKEPKGISGILKELSGMIKHFEGIESVEIDSGVTASGENYCQGRIMIKAKEKGFKGQAVFVEGTPKEFITNLQVGPNQGQGFRLSVGDIRAFTLKISASDYNKNTGVIGAAFYSEREVTDGLSSQTIEHAVDVSTEECATAAITVYDNAIVQVAQLRGALGAIQNRLEYTAANLENTGENLTAALSRIEDTDMALEMSEFTKYNILIQAGTAMLAQANQRPQTVLQLLGG